MRHALLVGCPGRGHIISPETLKAILRGMFLPWQGAKLVSRRPNSRLVRADPSLRLAGAGVFLDGRLMIPAIVVRHLGRALTLGRAVRFADRG